MSRPTEGTGCCERFHSNRTRRFGDSAVGAGGSYQSREERNSQMPEVIVQQAAVHHVPEDGDAS